MKKIFLLTILFCSSLLFAQNPCPPNTNCDGGLGGDGYGNQASPIDMYVYILGIIAILFIAYFAKRYKAQKVN